MESLVNFVVGKLGDMIVKEAKFLGGVGKQVKWVETELKRIQCCLIDADTKQRKGDARAENWLNELRDVTYRIEDAIDTFYVEIEDSRQKDSSGFLHKFNKLCCMPMKVPCLHKLGKELREIRDALDGISKSRIDYGIEALLQDTEKGRSQADELPMRAKAYLDVDETKIVGLDADKGNILKLLFNSAKTPRRAVITIVGPGGLGKTTLARMVYERAKTNFDHHIMLSVSQHYNSADVVRRILNEPPQEVDLESMMPKLKSYLSDCQIETTILIRMWVAERFVPQNDKKTLEEAAEDCLQQLFERNMVQLSQDPYCIGRICRVHDLLRDLAIHEAEKINFVTIFRNPEDVNHSHRVTRRASLQSDDSYKLIKHVGPKTRSLLWCLTASRKIGLLNFSEFRLLRVLEIVDVGDMEIRGLEQLIHLKYVAINNCYVSNFHIESSLGHLKNLETFNLEDTFIDGEFEPTGLWTISTLRHVLTPLLQKWVLPFNANLRNLQTLGVVQFSEESYKHDQFPCLNRLRELSLDIKERSDAIAPLLGTMSCLLTLYIFNREMMMGIPKELVYPTALPNYQDLQFLYLDGMWDKSVSLEARWFPRHLAILSLRNSLLGQDPMPELGKLQTLKTLTLIGTILGNGRNMICPTGFPVLETLDVRNLVDVDLLRVEKRVMPKLKNFRKEESRGRGLKLELPPELQHIITHYN
ncbi:Disease resistance protein (CC-NBS-LRR class) family protein [Rhynchospora pubera]|uniref:Disease resistance protein (CC-NBS-LRR class) family protein n=1 Tax=Rhynchospora pubera TaxID=906938 RepID=A0AAV8FZK6_9POAL|nr:Disease resistance protein (CC-NBS-LRR class) family protein [Rhynchospora pubera]